MLINKASIQAAFVTLKATFNKAFEGAPSDWQKTAMLMPSTTKQNDYGWLSRFPKMRKWIGEKVVKALRAHSYTITNDDFEATVAVDRNDIEDDLLGIYSPMAQDAGSSAKLLPDELVSELKDNAFTELCYDGQPFYDTDHPVGDNEVISVSNKITAPLSSASLVAAKASYGALRRMIMEFKDDEGRPLGLMGDTLEVPPALETEGKMLLTSEKLADDTPNPFKGTAELLVNPRLTDSKAYFLHVTKRPLKPFIYQERKKPVFVNQTDMSSDNVFMRKEFKFGAEARAAVGFGLWQLSAGSDGSA